jgi:ABC-type polysaccharide/polyol phosphate transport system ATPase subunit
MSDTVIRVENLGKLYRLGEIGTGTISHDLNRWWARVRGKEDPFAKVGQLNDRTQESDGDYVWALKDINFDVKQGEVLGIIGRNGAGKSTLLKILSKVTTPTTGQIKVKGRIASLLEVGTGFHPELTGRENIYLNGAILGMSRAEIRSKFDEMVAFAGVERYIDTPVKRYSSGMYVRLAFAVAAFLEPEILIVDEVLAVGDAEFQRKCIGKMKEVSESQGRTVLFVSHNLSQVQSLCTRGLLLQHGILGLQGDIGKVIQKYVHGANKGTVVEVGSFPRGGHGIGGFRFEKIEMLIPSDIIYEGDPLRFQVIFRVEHTIREALVGITISDAYQTLVECRSTATLASLDLEPGQQGIEVELLPNLAAGNYTINLGARCLGGLLEYVPSVMNIEILPNPGLEAEDWKKGSAGVIMVKSDWSFPQLL